MESTHGMDDPGDRAECLRHLRGALALTRAGHLDGAIRWAGQAKAYADGYGEADYRARRIADEIAARADIRLSAPRPAAGGV